MKISKLCAIVITSVFLLCGASLAADKKDITKLKELSRSESGKSCKVYNRAYNKIVHKILFYKENKAEHDHFDWKYHNHYLYVVDDKSEYSSYMDFITIIVKEYQEHSSIGRSFVLWELKDYNNDGIVDSYARYYVIVNDDNGVITPYYPEGFRDKSWLNPTQEQAQKRYDEEISFWFKKLQEVADATDI